MIIDEDRQEMLAMARKTPNQVEIQLPDQKVDAPEYVRTTGAAPNTVSQAEKTEPGPSLVPIGTSAKEVTLNQTSNVVNSEPTVAPTVAADPRSPTAEMSIPSDLASMKAGEKIKVAIGVNGSTEFRSAVMGLKFDAAKFAIRSVSYGDAFGSAVANTAATPFLNQNGKMYVSLTAREGSPAMNGSLMIVEIEALSDGQPLLEFDRDVLNFQTAEGKNFVVKYKP
jgi:hypothetical protein